VQLFAAALKRLETDLASPGGLRHGASSVEVAFCGIARRPAIGFAPRRRGGAHPTGEAKRAKRPGLTLTRTADRAANSVHVDRFARAGFCHGAPAAATRGARCGQASFSPASSPVLPRRPVRTLLLVVTVAALAALGLVAGAVHVVRGARVKLWPGVTVCRKEGWILGDTYINLDELVGQRDRVDELDDYTIDALCNCGLCWLPPEAWPEPDPDVI